MLAGNVPRSITSRATRSTGASRRLCCVDVTRILPRTSDEIAPVGPLRRRWARPRCGTRKDVVHARRQAGRQRQLQN